MRWSRAAPPALVLAALVLAALVLAALGCDGRSAAVPDPTAAPPTGKEGPPAPAPARAPAPTWTAAPRARVDPALVPGPGAAGPACQADGDCAPRTPCGMTEPGLCAHRTQVSQVIAECAAPKPSTYRCACEAGRCVSRPLAP